MKIESVHIHRFRVVEDIGELELAWSPGTMFNFQLGGGAVLEIVADNGLRGLGPEVDDRFLPAMREILIGEELFDVERLSAKLRYYCQSGTHYQHIGGADIALWDLVGKAAGQPLYKLWGSTRDKIKPYAAMVLLSTPEERADMAMLLKEQNWPALKLRLHHDDMRDDIRTVEMVRKAVGDDMAIMIDANQAQSKGEWQPGVIWDYRRALNTARALEELGCYWLEEPRPRFAFEESAQLQKSVGIPIAGGENLSEIHEFQRICELDAYSVLQPECLVVNGITAMRKVGSLAETHNKKIAPHNGYGRLGLITHMHLVSSWPHAPFLEVINDPPIGSYEHFFSIFENPPRLTEDGYFEMPNDPGLGVEIKRDWIEETI